MSGPHDFDFEFLRTDLEKAVPKAGASDMDPVLMFKVILLQEEFDLTDEQMADWFFRNRRRGASVLVHLGLASPGFAPNAEAIRRFRTSLAKATLDGGPARGALERRTQVARNDAYQLNERVVDLLERASMSGLQDRGKGAQDPTVGEELSANIETMGAPELRWLVCLLQAGKKIGRPSKAARDWKISIEYHCALSSRNLALAKRDRAARSTRKSDRGTRVTGADVIAQLAAEYGCDAKTIEAAIRSGDRIERERKSQPPNPFS